MEIRTSSFPYGGPQFPHLPYQANISNHCELHRPSASELLGLKSTDSWAPDLDTSRTYALSGVSTVGNFVPHYSSKTLVEKSLRVIPTKAILGFLDVRVLEVSTQRKNRDQEPWTKSSLSPLGKPCKTRLLTWAVLQSKAEPARSQSFPWQF